MQFWNSLSILKKTKKKESRLFFRYKKQMQILKPERESPFFDGGSNLFSS